MKLRFVVLLYLILSWSLLSAEKINFIQLASVDRFDFRYLAKTYINMTMESAKNINIEVLKKDNHKFLQSNHGNKLLEAIIWNSKKETQYRAIFHFQVENFDYSGNGGKINIGPNEIHVIYGPTHFLSKDKVLVIYRQKKDILMPNDYYGSEQGQLSYRLLFKRK
jgi:hypothetical protein